MIIYLHISFVYFKWDQRFGEFIDLRGCGYYNNTSINKLTFNCESLFANGVASYFDKFKTQQQTIYYFTINIVLVNAFTSSHFWKYHVQWNGF